MFAAHAIEIGHADPKARKGKLAINFGVVDQKNARARALSPGELFDEERVALRTLSRSLETGSIFFEVKGGALLIMFRIWVA
jgi:hypothetical protein